MIDEYPKMIELVAASHLLGTVPIPGMLSAIHQFVVMRRVRVIDALDGFV